MSMSEQRAPVHPGEAAPEFTLPTADGQGIVRLADYRGRSPVFLALLNGLWCPFCRRQIARISATEGNRRDRAGERAALLQVPPDSSTLRCRSPAVHAPRVRRPEAGP